MKYLFILFLLASCGNDDMKKIYELKDLRVLAIIASEPEINSPATVNLTPYLSYPKGGDTILDIEVTACPDPGIAFGAKVSCDNQNEALIHRESLTFNTATIGSANLYTGEMDPVAIVISPTLYAGMTSQLNSTLAYNGIDYLVIFEIQDQNSKSQKMTSFKRIKISTKNVADLNSNPTIAGDLLFRGSPLIATPTRNGSFKLTGISTPQSFPFKSFDGEKTLKESQYISWFASTGDFTFSKTDTDAKNPFKKGKQNSQVFLTVLRDGRGGIAVKRVVTP